MKSKKIAAVVLGSVVLVASALPAMAQEVRKDALNNVYIGRLNPGSVHDIGFDGTLRTRGATANRCGVVKVSPSLTYSAATQISLASVVSDISTLGTATPGNCSSINGVYTNVGAPAATRFKDAIGAIYFQGLTPSSDQVVTYPDLSVTRKITANACGIIKLSNTLASPITNSSILKINGGGGTAVSDISTAVAPSCKKISETQSVMMISIQDKNNWGS